MSHIDEAGQYHDDSFLSTKLVKRQHKESFLKRQDYKHIISNNFIHSLIHTETLEEELSP